MLVLTRKKFEKVVITGGITVTVVDVKDGKVRLGFECPPAVAVYRAELIPPGAPVPPSNALAAGLAAACLPPDPAP